MLLIREKGKVEKEGRAKLFGLQLRAFDQGKGVVWGHCKRREGKNDGKMIQD